MMRPRVYGNVNYGLASAGNEVMQSQPPAVCRPAARRGWWSRESSSDLGRQVLARWLARGWCWGQQRATQQIYVAFAPRRRFSGPRLSTHTVHAPNAFVCRRRGDEEQTKVPGVHLPSIVHARYVRSQASPHVLQGNFNLY